MTKSPSIFLMCDKKDPKQHKYYDVYTKGDTYSKISEKLHNNSQNNICTFHAFLPEHCYYTNDFQRDKQSVSTCFDKEAVKQI